MPAQEKPVKEVKQSEKVAEVKEDPTSKTTKVTKTKKKAKKEENKVEPEPIKLSKKKRQFFIPPSQEEIEPDSEPEPEPEFKPEPVKKQEILGEKQKDQPSAKNATYEENDEEEHYADGNEYNDPYAKYEEEYNMHKHMYDVEAGLLKGNKKNTETPGDIKTINAHIEPQNEPNILSQENTQPSVRNLNLNNI